MKKLLLIFAVLAGMTAQGQTVRISNSPYSGDVPNQAITDMNKTFTVHDTTYQSDARLNFLISTILPAVEKNLSEEMARQKVNGEVTHEAETVEFWNDLTSALQKYTKAFIQVVEVQVDTSQIVKEFNQLNEKIAALQSDPDIKYIEAVQEFKNIQERQAKLAKYYTQITATPNYPAWSQPAGAHDAYKKADRVTHKTKIWENTIDANVWEPGVTGWREIK